MKPITAIILATGLLAVGNAQSADMPEVARKNNCANCHAIDKKVVGPAWAEVSKKYKGDVGAATKLSAKISKGGSGVWGTVSMPPNKVSDADLKELVGFILKLAK